MSPTLVVLANSNPHRLVYKAPLDERFRSSLVTSLSDLTLEKDVGLGEETHTFTAAFQSEYSFDCVVTFIIQWGTTLPLTTSGLVYSSSFSMGSIDFFGAETPLYGSSTVLPPIYFEPDEGATYTLMFEPPNALTLHQ